MLFILGAVFLLVSIAASLMLVLQHLAGMALPGCGVGSPCAALASSIWGKVPLIKLPTASVGLSYFIAVLIGWIIARGRVTNQFRWIVRFGVLMSLILLAVIVIKKQACWYCLAAHAGNLAFWMMMECRPEAQPALRKAAAALIIAFLACTAALGGVEWQRTLKIARDEASQKDQSIQEMIANSQKQAQAVSRTAVPVATTTLSTVSAGTAASTTAPAATPPAATRTFLTGRWRQGPAVAPIRIVIFSDYQCTDCRNIDLQARLLLKSRNDISVTSKHFPFCDDCNKHLTVKMHPNACWAARAAETAGMLRGQAGFSQMHEWLFDRGGGFTDQELRAGLAQMGYNVDDFIRQMQSSAPLKPIADDCDEAIGLGLFFTPMVFINGVELRGYRTPNALIDAVQQLAASNPPALGPEADHPAAAVEKGVEDWRQQRVLPLESFSRTYPWGVLDSSKATVKFVIFGDMQDAQTATLDGLVRKAIAGRTDAQYVFRHFPFDQACNSIPNTTKNPLACRAARALEAAGKLGGRDAYWMMQDWLLANAPKYRQDDATPEQNGAFRGQFDAALRQAVLTIGLNPEALFAMMEEPAVTAAITEDINMARAAGLSALPSLFLNNKQVVRWTINDEIVLDRLVNQAATMK